ncbi:MAG: glycoside hydrolase family 57 protein [Halioglobus sp.]|nr:glycoside hydrolase family 57 protein [Halioglobus sp.]
MSSDAPMNVVLCWHMHQPEYRDLDTGMVHLPWTYLHAIKDYVDMAAHLEAVPEARAVVNFTPVLLEQIQSYIEQIEAYLAGRGVIRDPVLAELAEPALPSNPDALLRLMRDCLRVNPERVIARFPAYQRLANMARWYEQHPESLIYCTGQFPADLLVWYHLGWIAESVRRSDVRIRELQNKEYNFSLHDRRELLGVILELLQSVVPRYRALAEQGRVELSVSPYAHPIVPLLLDMTCAKEAMPDVQLPVNTQYPGGEERVRWHLQRGLEVFEKFFHCKPRGLWPSEGGVSQQAIELFPQYGFEWAASGGGVLSQSHESDNGACQHRIFRFGEADIDCIFRDDGLSDLIGFTYSDWDAGDAVADLVSHLENVAAACPDRNNCVVSIILDGENAWEYYPENGYAFLSELYRALTEHPQLKLTTFSEFRDECSPEPIHESRLTAGSWVYGTFSTWIGDPDKNRGWEMLVEAKHSFDARVASGSLGEEALARAEHQLAMCESSDWFWWFGDYNPSETVVHFDQLYRMHLAHLYNSIDVIAPAHLGNIISRGHGHPERGGVMRKHSENPGTG